MTYLVIQSKFMVPPPMDDQLNYFQTASDLPPSDPLHQESRIGLLIPVWLLIQVFGYSEVAYYAVPLASAVVLVGGTYLLGRLIFDRLVATLSSLLIVANPYVLWHSSHLLPDITATATLTLALGILIYACRRQGDQPDDRRGKALFIVSGLLLGASYLIREFTIVLFIVAVLVLVVYRQPRRPWGLVALGAFIPFAAELVWNGVLYGNPFNRLEIVLAHGGTGGGRFDPSLTSVAGDVWREFLSYDGGEFWIILSLALGVLPLVLLVRRRGIRDGWILFAWGIGMWLFLTAVGALPSIIAGERFTILRTHKLRYWYPMLPALVVGGLGYLGAVIPTTTSAFKSLRIVVLSGIVALPVWMGISDLDQFSLWKGDGGDHYEQFQALLHQNGEQWETVWALDGAWRATTRALPMYTRDFWGRQFWEGEIAPLNDGAQFPEQETLQDGLLVFHPRAIGSVVPRQNSQTPDYVKSPPKSWTTALVSPNGELAAFDIGSASRSTSLYENKRPNWQVIGLSGWEIEDSRLKTGRDIASLELEPRERAFIMDGQAKGYRTPGSTLALESGFARGEVEISSSVGGSIAGSVPAGIPNGHRVRLFCFIYYKDGSREQRLAVAAPFTKELDRVGFVCPEVDESQNPIGTRVGIKAVGPAIIEVGDLDLWWQASED
ncbi:MAG: ArnT family glycosyltransferase [Actinomycetota bacterium]